MSANFKTPYDQGDSDELEMEPKPGEDMHGVVLSLDGRGESEETKTALREYLLKSKHDPRPSIRDFSIIELAEEVGIRTKAPHVAKRRRH